MAKNSVRRLATSRRKQWQNLLQNSAANTVSGKTKSLVVLIDTNIWYSAILYGGRPEEAVKFCINNTNTAISPYIINEIRVNLKNNANAPYKWLNALEKHLKQLCLNIDVDIIPIQTRDPKDDSVIATALLGKCNYLITGDDDLLSLKMVDNLQIVTVNEFLMLVEKPKW